MALSIQQAELRDRHTAAWCHTPTLLLLLFIIIKINYYYYYYYECKKGEDYL